MASANGAPPSPVSSPPTNGHISPPTSPSISWPLNRPASPGPWSPRVEQELRAREASTITTSRRPPAASLSRIDPGLLPHQPKSLSSISLQAFSLGCTFTIGLLVTLVLLLAEPFSEYRHWWRVSVFLSILSTFHFLEFWTTAHYNTPRVDASSFLLFNNGTAYFVAQASAFLEASSTSWIFPSSSAIPPYSYLRAPVALVVGFGLVLLGQLVRSTAMAHLGTNFHHIVQVKRSEGHELVTSGIYATLRHPSYFGFFWWAVGTQILLGNFVCLILYVGVLWTFFGRRIKSKCAIEMVMNVKKKTRTER